MTSVFLALAWDSLLGASVIFTLAACYTFLMFREVIQSGRASAVMFLAISDLLLAHRRRGARDPGAGIMVPRPHGRRNRRPVRLPGKRTGTKVNRKPERTGKGDLDFTGGRRLAVINAACAAVLLGMGVAHFVLQAPTAAVGAVFAGATLAGRAFSGSRYH